MLFMILLTVFIFYEDWRQPMAMIVLYTISVLLQFLYNYGSFFGGKMLFPLIFWGTRKGYFVESFTNMFYPFTQLGSVSIVY